MPKKTNDWIIFFNELRKEKKDITVKEASSIYKNYMHNAQYPFYGDIEQLTLENKNYREVLYTTENMQLVLMSLKPDEEIGLEIHHDESQFFRFESGFGIAQVESKEYIVQDGDSLIVPPGSEHNIINTHPTERLQLYTIYTPPHHPPNTKQRVKPPHD